MNLSFSTHPAYLDPATNAGNVVTTEASTTSAGIGNALTQLREGFTDRIRHYASKLANVQLLDPAPERRECQHAIAKGMIGTAARIMSFAVPFTDMMEAEFESEEESYREWVRVDVALSIGVSGVLNALAQIDHYRTHPDAKASDISGMTWMHWLANKRGYSETAQKRLDTVENVSGITVTGGPGHCVTGPRPQLDQAAHRNRRDIRQRSGDRGHRVDDDRRGRCCLLRQQPQPAQRTARVGE